MKIRIEEVSAMHPNLFLEPHIIACVGLLEKYSESPASIDVECIGIFKNTKKQKSLFALEVSWEEETAEKGKRLRSTIQGKPLVELSAIALASILANRVVNLGQLDITQYGDRADFRSIDQQVVLEISGTEKMAELRRRHREKTSQAISNPLGWDAFVIVCGFSSKGHRILFSKHNKEDF